MPEPPKKNSTDLKAAGLEKFEFDDDMDVNNTMKSIEWAEDQYGYNGHHYNYSLGGYLDSSNNYTGWESNTVDPKKRDWWNYLVRDQFDGMRSVGRELNTAELDKAGVSQGEIHDRMAEYERMLGAKAAAGKLSDEDREYARNLKAHLFGIHDGSYHWDWNHGAGFDQDQEVPTPKRGKFQLTPEEMKAAKADVHELKDQKYKKRTAGQNVKEEENEELPPELNAKAGGEELPPELNPNAAAQKGEKEAAPEAAAPAALASFAMQKSSPAAQESETFSVAQQKSNMDKAGRNTINIEGMDIKVEDMNDMQMNSDDLIQLGEVQNQKVSSNQEQLYELMGQN